MCVGLSGCRCGEVYMSKGLAVVLEVIDLR